LIYTPAKNDFIVINNETET